ncbi:MAG: sodium:calcium symporter, partial [Candidatus Omnitrophica bacterium]|nr:sodium:calcium symporter [Candidatus Omnitrophota bacterium]
ESWTLAFSFFAVFGKYTGATTEAGMQSFLRGFQGLEKNQYFNSLVPAYTFFMITFLANIWVIYHGIKGGIERLCKIAMPLLLLCGIIVMARVFSLGAPDPSRPSWNLVNGLGFLWNPDLSALLSAKVWLAASGQILFTLSVGIGVILTYASYLSKGDDVVLSGLSAAGTNEFIEVIIGGSIIIPAAFVFFGPQSIQAIARGGAFNLGFVTMPLIFQKIAFAGLFGGAWFLLLFLSGITSSISLAQPAIAFLEDEFNITRARAASIFGAVTFILCQPAIFLLGKGVVNELDFWGGTFCLVLFATVEIVLFAWVFGMEKAWQEIHHGADMRIPKAYKFIIKYITPLFLFAILGFWFYQDGIPTILMKNVAPSDRPFILGTRIFLVTIFVGLAVMVKMAWSRKRRRVKS